MRTGRAAGPPLPAPPAAAAKHLVTEGGGRIYRKEEVVRLEIAKCGLECKCLRSLTYTHIHARARAHTHTHTHTHNRTIAQSHNRTIAQSHNHTHKHERTNWNNQET